MCQHLQQGEKRNILCREFLPTVQLVTYVTDGGDSDDEFSKVCFHATVL
jgi:hypothetical protein